MVCTSRSQSHSALISIDNRADGARNFPALSSHLRTRVQSPNETPGDKSCGEEQAHPRRDASSWAMCGDRRAETGKPQPRLADGESCRALFTWGHGEKFTPINFFFFFKWIGINPPSAYLELTQP